MQPQRIYLNEDNEIKWSGARSAGSPVESGTAVWSLKKKVDLSEVAQGSLSHVAESGGDWSGIINSTVAEELDDGESYFLDITMTSGGSVGFRRIPCLAMYHGST